VQTTGTIYSISIIIPVLNESAIIGQRIRQLLDDSQGQVHELLVIDGGSKDNTVELAEAAGARVLHCPISSRAAQMNLGAAAATGNVLYFIHADTQPPATFVSDIKQALQTGIDMGCYRYRFDSARWLLKVNASFTRFHWLWCQGGDKTFFILKTTFEALEGYCERHIIMEEYDFLRRARQAGYTFRVLPQYALVSARKYEKKSWLRVQLANIIAFNYWHWGASPNDVRRVYAYLLR
jgi:rSAM/selenodomain-associated transferase 2